MNVRATTTPKFKKTYRWAAGGLVAALGVAACGSSTSKAATSPTTAAPPLSTPTTSGSPGTAVSTAFMVSTSNGSFSSTVSGLKGGVSSAGLMVLGTLNQAGALSVTGLHLPGAETFFVGNPTVGKALFDMNPAVGAVLPVRMYVWVDAAGKTNVGYLDPASLAQAVDASLATPASKLAMAASKIAQAATGSAPTSKGSFEVTFTKVTSSKSFGDTVSAFKSAVSSAGMMVLGNLNQAGALSVAGLHLRGAQSFFVGNPTTGKALFEADRAVGMEIPVDFYLWVDSTGKTQIGYFSPSTIFTGIDPALSGAGQKFAGMATMISGNAS